MVRPLLARLGPLALALVFPLTACDALTGGDKKEEAPKEEPKKEEPKKEETGPPEKTKEQIEAELRKELEAEFAAKAAELEAQQKQAEEEAKKARGHCPEGMLAVGKGPPDGSERWCEAPGEDGKPAGQKEGLYEAWHENGKVSQEIFFKDGKEHGHHIAYYPSGTKETQGEWSNGVQIDVWETWSQDGKPHSKVTYDAAGKLHGPSVTYHSNGVVHIKSNYVSGKLDGAYSQYYESGKKQREGTYKSGLIEGTWTDYDESGASIGTETYENGVVVGLKCPDGSTREETDTKDGGKSIACMVDGKKHGPAEEKYASGKVLRAGLYAKGLKEGVWTAYWEDTSKTKASVEYLKGKRDGTFTSYQEDGVTLRERGDYIDGKREGKWTEYHEDGTPKANGEYLVGKKHGQWVYFHENGNKRSHVFFRDGDRNGAGVRYHKNGKLKATGRWLDDKRVGQWRLFDKKGVFKEIETCDPSCKN